MGKGWYELDWFGVVYRLEDSFIHHPEHGWLFSDSESAADFWFYDFNPEMGWLWTSEEMYPHIYRRKDDSWLWYDREAAAPRWFFNFLTNAWEHLPMENKANPKQRKNAGRERGKEGKYPFLLKKNFSIR